MLRLSVATLFVTLGLGSGIVTALPAAGQHAGEVGGTYEIQICRTPCDPAHPDAMVRGILVLEDTPFALASLPDSARAYLEEFSPYLLDRPMEEGEAPADAAYLNACFLIEATHHAPTDAGISRAAATAWSRDSTGAIRIGLFQSPDEGYVARVVVEGGALKGTGRSWAAGERGAARPEFVSGRRIGPPDRARCARGIEAEAARERAWLAIDSRADRQPRPRRAPAPFRLLSTPLATILSDLLAVDRVMPEVRGDGPWAFDPRPVRVSRGRAPEGWPDSVAPRWLGDVRDAQRSRADVARLLAELNGGTDPPNWAACGGGGASPACDLATYPAVVAASEPWVQGDRAQLLIYVRDRPRFSVDPTAWYANVVFLERAEGVWRVVRVYNVAGSWTR